MSQLSFLEPPVWSVTELTRYLRELLVQDDKLKELWVLGEVSNFTRAASGHLYFTLKDATSALKCVMWRTQATRLGFTPRDGQAVEARGKIDIYEIGGVYQLYVDMLRPAGEGVLFQEFMRLKAQLEAEGLFVPEHKRSIPRWPNCIGVVTSPTGAALRDILNTIRRRYPLVRVVLCPTPVQGDQAPDGIVAALQSLNETVRPDVILLARGGGSIEDLWAFNDERVARAVYNSHVPVVCGVGHETDFTIADFVADLRAPTPTAAAELTTPDKQELLAALQDLTLRMRRAGQVVFLERRRALDNSFRRLNSQSPQKRIRSDRQHIDELIRTANALFAHRLQLLRLQLKANEQKMETLNPLAVLQRGYAILSLPDGQIVRSIEQAHPGDPMNARVADGTFPVEVRRRDYRSISP